MNKAFELAEKEIGTLEWKEGSNPKVVAYFADAGIPGVTDDATAWCAAFVGAMLHRSGVKGTVSALARSYLNWGTNVERKDAKPGDIVVFKRANSTWQGHVAFFVRDNGSTITVLGGNQADAVNRRAYPSASLLGIRRAVASSAPAVIIAAPSKPVVVSETQNTDIKTTFWAALIAFFTRKGN